jgi:4-alpha-glucanotransferase
MMSYEELTEPRFTKEQMVRLFGHDADFMMDKFTVAAGGGKLKLNSKSLTQKAIYEQCKRLGVSEENTEKMLTARTWVLFIKDKNNERELHPRIAKERNEAYNALSDSQKAVYDRIYDEYFYHRNDALWHDQAMMKLPALLRASGMIVCGEDLGMIPDCVPDVMKQLKILTLEIQSMPKQEWAEFDNLSNVPYYAVCTTTTHDMPPLRLWWEQSMERTQRYYVTMLQKEGRAPDHLPAHIAEEILARHLYCPSMLCILPLQDWLAIDGELRRKQPAEERINTPSDAYNRWQWRMHLTIEQLLEATKYNNKVKTMIQRSKR